MLLFKRCLLVIFISISLFCLGCGDTGNTKNAGPGGTRQQPFDGNTGQYKLIP